MAKIVNIPATWHETAFLNLDLKSFKIFINYMVSLSAKCVLGTAKHICLAYLGILFPIFHLYAMCY